MTGHKLPPGMEVFHRTFLMPDANEKVPTALVKREDERRMILVICIRRIKNKPDN